MKENKDHLVLHRANHLDQIRNVAVKTYRHVVVHQIAQELHVKHVMAQILVVHVLLQWIEINLAYVHEFLNQIFQKM
jgi:ribosomal protein S25